jgi:CBS domain-containing protein
MIAMNSVKELLASKSDKVWTISPQATVFEALELMADKNIGAVVVVNGGKVQGIFTERDYARKIALKGKTSRTTSVGELMTTDVLYVDPEATIEDCMALMTDKRHRHIPVLVNEELVGIVSIGDVVKAVIRDRESTIRTLETYITGGHTSL